MSFLEQSFILFFQICNTKGLCNIVAAKRNTGMFLKNKVIASSQKRMSWQ